MTMAGRREENRDARVDVVDAKAGETNREVVNGKACCSCCMRFASGQTDVLRVEDGDRGLVHGSCFREWCRDNGYQLGAIPLEIATVKEAQPSGAAVAVATA